MLQKLIALSSLRALSGIVVVLFAGGLFAQDSLLTNAKVQEASRVHFDLEALSKRPEVFPAEDMQVEGVRTFFYAGPMYHGKPTRVFAYYGIPARAEGDEKQDQRFPAMVLIHDRLLSEPLR